MHYEKITSKEYSKLKDKSGRYKVCSLTGTKSWYQNDISHRDDGPAITYPDGSSRWFLNGKIHRTDGPAVYLGNGDVMYYLNGSYFNKEEWFSKLTKEELAIALANPENF